MSDNFISNVLNILRLVRDTELSGHPPPIYIRQWANAEISQSGTLRVCAYIQDQCAGAQSLIEASRLPHEAKAGLNQTVQALVNAFSIEQINSQLIAHFPQLASSISSFAILEGSLNLHAETPEVQEVLDLVHEMEEIIKLFDDPAVDAIVRDTAKKHLYLLIALLNNAKSFGVDAAMAAYAELVIRLRRVDGSASEASKAKTSKVWPTIEKWLGRLAIIDKAYSAGQGLLEHGHGLAQLLIGHAP